MIIVKKPKIRFKGFTETWEQRKLEEICESFEYGLNAAAKEYDGENKYIRITDIDDNSHEFIQDDVTSPDIDLTNSENYQLKYGDVIFTRTGASVGKTYIYKESDGLVYYAGFLIRGRVKSNYSPEFIFQNTLTDDYDKFIRITSQRSGQPGVNAQEYASYEISVPKFEEQQKIGAYFSTLDHLITLHQRKCENLKKLKKFMLQKLFPQNGENVPEIRFSNFTDTWEQRKLEEICESFEYGLNAAAKEYDGENKYIRITDIDDNSHEFIQDDVTSPDIDLTNSENYQLKYGDVIFTRTGASVGKTYIYKESDGLVYYAGFLIRGRVKSNYSPEFIFQNTLTDDYDKFIRITSQRSGQPGVNAQEYASYEISVPKFEEQQKIGAYFSTLDHLITLHQHKLNILKGIKKYMIFGMLNIEGGKNMPELESIIEKNLIDQLVLGDSQWTYRPDLKSEKDLWDNFRYILEQNNKDRLNGQPLSDNEFEQVKNQLQFSSFYKAGEWLVGENGKVMIHVQRDTEKLHLVVMNHEHIAGGSSVYEVINQYSTLQSDKENGKDNNSRFDVTLMINGLPMIHIELKNKSHPYMEAFNQIKRYIGEGKFTGIFSAVQMFVVSNGVDTKYFSAASDTELNPKFMSGWLDEKNNPVTDYIDFAKSVLSIPQAHEMIARYTVLDEDSKRLILLRPYQIHAIEAIRESSKQGKSGYVWHTTGSGKTLTSYKATRNLLMDIPSIDKTIFLIDRKDLDAQTTLAFQAYANNDLVDVDETENVNDLKKKLKSDDRQVIVTTIQKLQRLVTKRLKEDTPEYNKIKNLKLGFIVDECHRAVTPATKRELERFFKNSLWFGFTGTPRFDENSYPQMGDLPRTTEALYGKCLHKYTIMNAIHDNAVLGFQVEHNGPKNIDDETDSKVYENEKHMLKVLDVVLNKSYHKLGFQNGKGKTYVGLLTTSSIQQAQKYYELLTKVKNGETPLVIDEKIKQVLPDFPKFAITYSVSENKDNSMVNQDKMKKSIDDYNKMFGTKFDISQIQSYNGNLNKRLARKDSKYKSRNEQLDLVIVVDRLLTGFDAPCMSTIYIDRQPMGPHDLIQAFSRTNRIFDKNKAFGQIVTFQAPVLFKECVDNAVKLYSAGGTKESVLAEWNVVEPAFKKALSALRVSAEKPEDIASMSEKEKKIFVKIFQEFDTLFAQLKSFTNYDDSMLKDYGITEEEYNDYVGHYKNVVEELKKDPPDGDEPIDEIVDQEYELMAYSNTKIDYEYIISLIQNIVTPSDDDENLSPEERQKKIDEIKSFVEDLRKDNPKIADIMSTLVSEIENDEEKYKGQSILNVVENMRQDCIDRVITDFCDEWKTSKEDVMYVAENYRNGAIINESAIKATSNYSEYKESQEKALPKFKYYSKMMTELRKVLEEEIKPLNHN